MKTKFYYSFILAFALAFIAPKANAQAKLIQFWDFNQTRPITGGGGDSLGTDSSYAHTLANDSVRSEWPLTADYVKAGLVAGHIVYSRPKAKYGSSGKRDSILDNGAGGSFFYDYSSTHYTYFTSSDSGFTEGNGYIRARNPSDSNAMYIYIPTTGYKNITFDFAISASSTKGANYGIFSYSVDSGATWKKLTTAMDTFNISGTKRPDTLQLQNPTTAASSWYPVQMNFSTDPTVNNTSKFVIRMMLAGPNTYQQTAGNARFDNFAVMGDTNNTTGIDEVPAQAAGYNVYPNPAGEFVNIISNQYTGDKVITIYNVVGQMVSVTENKDRQTIMNTSSLNSGVYFIEIKEVSTGNKYTEKLIKE